MCTSSSSLTRAGGAARVKAERRRIEPADSARTGAQALLSLEARAGAVIGTRLSNQSNRAAALLVRICTDCHGYHEDQRVSVDRGPDGNITGTAVR
jgi:cytochrome c553